MPLHPPPPPPRGHAPDHAQAAHQVLRSAQYPMLASPEMRHLLPPDRAPPQQMLLRIEHTNGGRRLGLLAAG